MNNAPCRGCERRHLKCHATCGDYLKFRRERDEENRRRWETYEADSFSIEKMFRFQHASPEDFRKSRR